MTLIALLVPETITPSSWFGWGGFVFGLIATAILLWDRITGRGKSIANLDNKIDTLCRQTDEMEGRLTVVDGLTRSVQELVFEWRGIDGNNGYKSIIRDHEKRLDAIEDRNREIDAIAKHERERQQDYGGPERRRSPRRDLDKELNDLLPDKDKP